MRCDRTGRARLPRLGPAAAPVRPGAFRGPRHGPGDPALLAAILAGLDAEDRRRNRHRAAAAVVAAAGAVVIASRGRRSLAAR